MRKIYAIGETTYDIVFRNGQPNRGVVGGSALNTAVSLGRMKLPVFFISRFGNDTIGNLSATFITNNGVDCRYISRYDGQSRIALAFLDENNNASYQFYHGSNAPRQTFPSVAADDIVHYGSLNAIAPKGRTNLLRFLAKAKAKGALVIYDPNIRNFASDEHQTIVARVEENISHTTIVKGSTQDFERLYSTSDPVFLFGKFSKLGAKALFITDGENPTMLITHSEEKRYPVEPVKAVSTIGAGDNFTAGIIYGLYKNYITSENIDSIGLQKWDDIVGFGHRFAREVCLSEMNYISEEMISKL